MCKYAILTKYLQKRAKILTQKRSEKSQKIYAAKIKRKKMGFKASQSQHTFSGKLFSAFSFWTFLKMSFFKNRDGLILRFFFYF